MRIDDELFARLEDAACLDVSPEEKPRLAAELEKTMREVSRLGEIPRGKEGGDV